MVKTLRFLLFSAVVCFSLWAVSFLSPADSSCSAGPAAAEAKRVSVVVGTAMLADVVQDLFDGKADIRSLIPAASCPGHHDVGAADMAFLARADAALIYPWQENGPVGAAVRGSAIADDRVLRIRGGKTPLSTEGQKALSFEVARLFALRFPQQESSLFMRSDKRINAFAKRASEVLQRLSPYRGTPVLCAQMQRDFVEWLGMKVVASYGRAEEMTPVQMTSLYDQGKSASIRVVIDNLQSGPETMRSLADELGARHVTFGNFPGTRPETATAADLMQHNAALLLEALSEGTHSDQSQTR